MSHPFQEVFKEASALQRSEDPADRERGLALYELFHIHRGVEDFRARCTAVPMVDTPEGWVLMHDEEVPEVVQALMADPELTAQDRREQFAKLLDFIDTQFNGRNQPIAPMVSLVHARWMIFYKDIEFRQLQHEGSEHSALYEALYAASPDKRAEEGLPTDPAGYYYEQLRELSRLAAIRNTG